VVVGDGEERRRSTPYHGSQLSRRQVAFSVKLGKIVTAYLPSGKELRGYIFGSDDYHWQMVSPELDTHLIHKSCSLSFGTQSYAQEPRHEELEKLVAPYRRHVEETVFGRQAEPAS
jgi:hypothetical protein